MSNLWDLNVSPDGEYYIWLLGESTEDKGLNSVMIKITDEVAQEIMDKTNCKASLLPF